MLCRSATDCASTSSTQQSGRPVSKYTAQRDEYVQPTGPKYKSCADAGLDECCYIRASGVITEQKIFPTNPRTDNGARGRAVAECDLRCAEYGGGANVRVSSSGSCVPAQSECEQRAQGPLTQQERTVEWYCLCANVGARDYLDGRRLSERPLNASAAPVASSAFYASNATNATAAKRTLNAFSRRRRAQSTYSSEGGFQGILFSNSEASIDASSGGHLDTSDTCYRDLIRFKSQHYRETAICKDYFDRTGMPADSFDELGQKYCDAAEPTECCVTRRNPDDQVMHSAHRL